jgi:hypothetical protein
VTNEELQHAKLFQEQESASGHFSERQKRLQLLLLLQQQVLLLMIVEL